LTRIVTVANIARVGRRGTTFGRTAVVAATSVAAVLVLLGRTPTAAQEPPPEPQPTVDSGTANANASVVSIAPTAGSLAFALSSGSAIAETAGGLAQAQAQSFDLGLIGSSLTAEGCDGNEAAVRPEQLPQPTQADNRHGDASAEDADAAFDGTGLGAGVERASATIQPASHAEATSTELDLEVVRIGGGVATADAEVLPDGAGREARAAVQMDLSLLGILDIDGMRWDAMHRTGAAPDAQGSFGFDALALLGIPIPASDLEGAQAAINDALLATGFRVELPRVERITEPVDLVRVTPLRLMIADSQLGAAGVRPALDATRELRSQLFDAVTGLYCSSASLLLVGEIGIGIGSGTGALIAEFGGAEARSAEVVYENPFGEAVAPPAAEPAAPDASPASPGGPRPSPAAPPLASAPTPAPAPVATATISSGVPVCRTVHPFRSPGCSQGAAAAVGVVGVAATAGMAVLDLRRRRVAA
jgi:hypothetical protein